MEEYECDVPSEDSDRGVSLSMILMPEPEVGADELLYKTPSDVRVRGRAGTGSTRSLLVSVEVAGSEFAMLWKEKLLDSVLMLERDA